jgi:murein DD-endopeptidase MepM/ murein hydrolase activator NlpD
MGAVFFDGCIRTPQRNEATVYPIIGSVMRNASLFIAAWFLIVGVENAARAQADTVCKPDPSGPVVQRRDFPVVATTPYVLPFEPGSTHVVWRTTSHFTPGNGGVGLYAIDFGMPVGTPIVAARAGKVVAVRDDFKDGNGRDLEENFVMVQHEDRTVARYIHLTHRGALVKLGATVRQGERIALSGNTGDTGGAHLHFDVQRCGPNLPPHYNRLPCGMTVPVTFRNAGPNACGLLAGKRYKANGP